MNLTSTITGATIPEAAYTFAFEGQPTEPWRVLTMWATEGLSELYAVVLELVCSDVAASPADMYLKRCELTVARDQHARRFCGVVRRVEELGATSTHRTARAYVAPELWLLSQRFGSAIHQDRSAIEVVCDVLARAHLVAPARLELRLRGHYARREYCVQYRESDLDFILRLLEHEGVGFYFDHAGKAEQLVLVDALGSLPRLPTMDGGPVPTSDGIATASVETVRSFAWSSQAAPTGVILRDFDFTRPMAYEALTYARGSEAHNAGQRKAADASRVVYDYPGSYTLGRLDDGRQLAEARHDEHRTWERTGHGQGNVVTAAPGLRFALADRFDASLSRAHVITRVEHTGAAPDESRDGAPNAPVDDADRYANTFETIDAEGAWRPRRITPKPCVHGPQTAIVVGAAGEEIHTDAFGRIKVKFHWDLRDGADVPAGLHTCWIRVAQSWSGAGWGTQFIPRVGMEVVVSFLEGDPDRPLVTGCVYNGAYPMPFDVPGDKTRSGIRTQTSLGGDGFNELSFEDARGAEQIYLHAQRDLDEAVVRDHTLSVGRDENLRVVRHQSLHVGGEQSEVVEANRRERVKLDHGARVDGNRETSIGQDETLRVEGSRYTVSTHDDQVVTQSLTARVGGRERREVVGARDLVVRDDRTTRIEGNDTTVVGRHDARRTQVTHVEGRAVLQSSDLTEIVSDKEIILRVGGSRVRITDERVELTGKRSVTVRAGNTVVQVTPEKARVRSRGKVVVSGDTVDVLSVGAEVRLSQDVKIKGAMVKLNPPDAAAEADDEPRDPEVTTLELVDETGRPLAGRRFVLKLGDGSEIAGVLDHEGRAVLEVDGSDARITFPEVREVKPG